MRGLGLRALLSAVESLVYAAQYTPPLLALPWTADSLARFSAVSSSFDMLAEWLIALGCVLAATGRAHRELASTNDELQRVQASLRAMVDVDALTGLASRSALRDIARSLRGVAAGVLFLDLRGFKAINDEGGHQAGDDVLRSFAVVLRESFRPEDATVRHGGDEFVVVARGVDRTQMMARVDDLRSRLAASDGWTRRLAFDAGYADLPTDGAFEEAIKTADLAMYDAKATASDARRHGGQGAVVEAGAAHGPASRVTVQ